MKTVNAPHQPLDYLKGIALHMWWPRALQIAADLHMASVCEAVRARERAGGEGNAHLRTTSRTTRFISSGFLAEQDDER